MSVATINLHGGSALLSLGGSTLHASLIEPAGASFTMASVNLRPPYKPSIGVGKLLVSLALATDDEERDTAALVTRIVVGLSVQDETEKLVLNPLAAWESSGPFRG